MLAREFRMDGEGDAQSAAMHGLEVQRYSNKTIKRTGGRPGGGLTDVEMELDR